MTTSAHSLLTKRAPGGTISRVNAQSHTLSPTRRAAIADLVARQGFVRVSALAERFGVNPATIRRDLQTLAEQGVLERVHGGAVSTAPASRPDAETRIGQTVAGMLADGDTIFLSPGPLPLAVADHLDGLSRLTIVTNSLAVAHRVATHTAHTLIVTGGQVAGSDLGLTGHLTRSALTSLRADHIILEMDGVNAADGLTADDLSQAEIARLLLGSGAQTIALVPAERIGRVAAAFVAPVSEIDVIVTTREAPSSHLWDLSEAGVRVVLA